MNKEGTRLTQRGMKRYAELIKSVIQLGSPNLPQLSNDQVTRGALITRAGDLAENTWFYRDLAVREGAKGAVLAETGDKLTFVHNGEPLSKKNPQDALSIQEVFSELPRSDFLILTFGERPEEVERGLWKIIVTIVEERSE